MKLADHPTSKLTAFPRIHSAKAFQERVYFGYGEWTSGAAATTLVSYTPGTNVLAVEHSVASDSFDVMREIDGTIYLPHCDPIHHEDFHDYSFRGPDGRWLQSLALEELHVFDFAKTPLGLFCSATSLYQSVDEGRTWTALREGDRIRWCAELEGALYSPLGQYTGQWQPVNATPSTFLRAEAMADPASQRHVLLGLETSTEPGSGGSFGDLRVYVPEGPGSGTLKSSVMNFTRVGQDIYILHRESSASGFAVQRLADMSTLPGTFDPPLPITGIPTTTTCLEWLNGKFYFGTSRGEIWVANADGSEVEITPPVIENRVYDAYGRGLAFSGDTLLVGAPDAFATTFLAGKAEIWRHHDRQWHSQQVFDPPIPDFSGWYGKDVAVQGDLAAVVETGHDLSGKDRGADANVHLYQFVDMGNTWVLRDSFRIPFAHSVALQEDLLVVGTSTGSGIYGSPGVIPYSITRAADGTVTLTKLSSLTRGIGYQPVARVALVGEFLIAAFSGDPSREAVGMIAVYQRDGAGFQRTPVQQFTVAAPDRFGFSLATHGRWVAVGAPLADHAIGPNAGAVFLFEIVNSAEGPLRLATEIQPPVPQVQAEFGASLALHDGLLLVGSPVREVGGVRHRGAVYRYRLQPSGAWLPMGEVEPPPASEVEFGIEVAVSDRWIAAGSLGSTLGATGLAQRVRILPRQGYEEWMDARQIAVRRAPEDDPDADGLPNVLEYAFNLRPAVADAAPAAWSEAEPSGLPTLTGATSENGSFMTFVRPKDDPFVTVLVESSDDLAAWREETGAVEVLGAGDFHELVRLPLAAEGARHWWRVRAQSAAD